MASNIRRTLTNVSVLAALVAGITAVAAVPASAATSRATRSVHYLGRTFSVPRDWAVVTLTPTTCVRFDRHALYLGTPGAEQSCPAGLVGGAAAIVAQPLAGSGTTGTVDDQANSRLVEYDYGHHVQVTAVYGYEAGGAARVAGYARLGRATPVPAGAVAPDGTPATRTPKGGVGPLLLPPDDPGGPALYGSGNYFGKGFDACAAPSTSTMNAWQTSSPYSAVGIYIGGGGRACSQPNLTAAWVTAQFGNGWRFMPIWFGPQASSGQITSPASQGKSEADKAVAAAALLGFTAATKTPIYYDMDRCVSGSKTNELAFLTAWTKELHVKGYPSGVYGSSACAIKDMVTGIASITPPDIISIAHYDNVATTADSNVPSTYWTQHQRVRQYAGDVSETWGGVTINIDRDYLDVAVTAASCPACF